MDQYVSGMDQETSISSRKAGRKVTDTKSPSLIEMMKGDPELKDFYKLVHENGWRDKAVALLNERLDRLRAETLK